MLQNPKHPKSLLLIHCDLHAFEGVDGTEAPAAQGEPATDGGQDVKEAAAARLGLGLRGLKLLGVQG